VGEFVFVSGQLPIDMMTGDLEVVDVKRATRNSLDNLKAVLETAGSSLGQIVKTTIFLCDMGDFDAVNEAYGAYFADDAPARSCVAVAGLPKGARVEVEAIAVK
jgi:2-iminobutanoate/2-iminopropanoate deaminase